MNLTLCIKKTNAALAMTIVILLSSASFAAEALPSDMALTIARGCRLYDLGKLKEAMAEFQAVLKEDPKNPAASDYLNKIWIKLNETGVTSQELSEQITGYKNAINARRRIEITDQQKPALDYGGKPYERFINQTSVGFNNRKFGSSSDTSFDPKGAFVAEHIRLDQPQNEWQNTFSLDARYHDNSHEDLRIRRIMYSLSNPNGMRFIAGDTSTNLSRYTMRGMYYRGVNFALKNEVNDFKILWGETPHFMTKTTEHPNREKEYIYPRKVFGVRDAYKVMDGYKIGVSYMELKDSERVRSIDPSYDPKLNRVVAIDQSIEAVPEKWNIETESAYSTSDEDRTDKDILVRGKQLKDFANYIRSELTIPKFRLVNSYERIGSDFRSYSDLASTNTLGIAGITSDREKIDNYLEYRPFEFDPIYMDLSFSRVRNNLEHKSNMEMTQQTNYGTGLRFSPDIDNWLPQSAIRLKVMNTLSVPGSDYASNDVSDRDIIFELAKKLYGVDLNTSYTYRKTIDNIETFGSYTNIYNIRAAKEITDMILLSGEYMHSDTTKNQDGSEGRTNGQNFINLSTGLRLWAGANLSLDYSYQDLSDKTGMLQDEKTNIYSTTFSWPFSHYFLNSGAELSFAPYLTYMITDSRKDIASHSTWTAALDATYQMGKGHRLSADFLYRNDQDNAISSGDTEDRRFLLTYQKIFQ